jgi:hypothetical protein
MADPKNREAPSSRVSAGGGAITCSVIGVTRLLRYASREEAARYFVDGVYALESA